MNTTARGNCPRFFVKMGEIMSDPEFRSFLMKISTIGTMSRL